MEKIRQNKGSKKGLENITPSETGQEILKDVRAREDIHSPEHASSGRTEGIRPKKKLKNNVKI